MREYTEVGRAHGRARPGTERNGEVRPGAAVRGAAGRAAAAGSPVAVGAGRPAGAPARGRVGRHPVRRPAGGPRPVRPAVVPVAVRPAQLERPACRAVPLRPGQRLLVRRPVAPPRPGLGLRVRRVLATAGAVVAAAAVVVGLGLVADVASGARGSDAPAGVASVQAAPAEVTLTVEAPGTVWELARTVSPGVTGPELAASVQRIVTANSLTSVQVQPGQVLRVPLG